MFFPSEASQPGWMTFERINRSPGSVGAMSLQPANEHRSMANATLRDFQMPSLRRPPRFLFVLPALVVSVLLVPNRSVANPSADPLLSPASPAAAFSPPVWTPAAPLGSAPGWEPVPDLRSFPTAFRPVPADRDPAELAIKPRVPSGPIESKGVFGLGGGARFADNDSTRGVVTGRAGYRVNRNLALSLRPSYVFYPSTRNINRNRFVNNNRNGSFQMPLTVDLFPDSVVSPYVGGGIASNADMTGKTDPMATAGLDITIIEHVTLGLNANYIFTNPSDNKSNGEWQIMTLLYLRP